MQSKTEVKHSNTPWSLCGSDRGVCSCLQIWSKPDDHPIAVVESGEWGDKYSELKLLEGTGSIEGKYQIVDAIIPYGKIDEEVAKANAQFIVRAVNAHEELLQACKTLIDPKSHGTLFRYAVELAEKAIAKAEGR